jgi:tetratricopeptide (TPR) repeat protein
MAMGIEENNIVIPEILTFNIELLLNNIGLCYLKMGANDEAEQAFSEAIRINKLKSPDPFVVL